MIEFLIEILGEFLLQLLIEGLIEFGLHLLAEPFQRPPTAWLAAIAYALFGAAAGGLSLFPFPLHFVPVGMWQVVNLVVTPVAVGLCMMGLGAWRARRGQTVFRIDRFSYGYLFALAFAVVRFCFAK